MMMPKYSVTLTKKEVSPPSCAFWQEHIIHKKLTGQNTNPLEAKIIYMCI